MEKKLLKSYLSQGLSLNQICKKTKKSLTTVRYWTNKHNLKSHFSNFKDQGKRPYGEFRFCPRCKDQVPTINFYSKRGKKHSSTYCKVCTNKQTIERQRNFKLQCVEYKGGRCQNPNCSVPGGYNRCVGGLEFHHLDPKIKNFTLSHLKSHKFNEVVKQELDKCIMICACCHREYHELK